MGVDPGMTIAFGELLLGIGRVVSGTMGRGGCVLPGGKPNAVSTTAPGAPGAYVG
jgi:hypothetical protein